MFVSIPSRDKPGLRWAVPLLFAAIWLAFLWSISRPDEARRSLWMDWGALSTGLTHPLDWWATLQDGSVLRLAYGDANGHPYQSIGRWLVAQGELRQL